MSLTNTQFFFVDHVIHNQADTSYSLVEKTELADAPICEQCGAFVGSMQSQPPFTLELERSGDTWAGFIRGAGDSALVSQRLATSFSASGLTGFVDFEQTTIKSIKPRRAARSVPNYLHVKVIRDSALVDDIASGISRGRLPECIGCLSYSVKTADRIVITPNTWSGADVFFARGLPGMILASQRYVDLVLASQFTNHYFVPLSQCYLPAPLQTVPGVPRW